MSAVGAIAADGFAPLNVRYGWKADIGFTLRIPCKADQRCRSGVARTMRIIATVLLSLTTLCACNKEPHAATENGTRVAPLEQNGGHEGLLVNTASPPGLLASALGNITSRNGCIVVDNGKTALVLIWPKGTVFDGERRHILVTHDDSTRTAYEIGHWQTLPGGAFSPVDGSSSAFLSPGNPKCRGEGFAVSNAKVRTD